MDVLMIWFFITAGIGIFAELNMIRRTLQRIETALAQRPE